MIRCGVLGWPVRHSRSPAMHEAAYRALGLDGWSYQLLPVPPELFEEVVRALPGAGFLGANVTIPHKEAALALADEATERARAIGAANTLTFRDDGTIHADNTDAPAIVAALPFDPAGASAIVLGAGGTARAAVWALRDAGATEVLVWNRTRVRAERLVAELGGSVVDRSPVDRPHVDRPPVDRPPADRPPADRLPAADILVNTTSVGLGGDDDPFAHLPLAAADLARHRCVVELVYGARATALADAARAAGVAVVEGREILVRQGALSFERWTGMHAPLDVMRAAAGASGPSRTRRS